MADGEWQTVDCFLTFDWLWRRIGLGEIRNDRHDSNVYRD